MLGFAVFREQIHPPFAVTQRNQERE